MEAERPDRFVHLALALLLFAEQLTDAHNGTQGLGAQRYSPRQLQRPGWLLLLLLLLLLLMLLAAAAAVAAAGPSLYFSCFQCLVHTSAKALDI